MFHKMPFILLLIIAGVLFANPILPLELKMVLYAASLTIKSVIMMLLPFIIFSLLFKTMAGLANRASVIILLILACVVVSNTLSTFLSHYVGEWVYQFNMHIVLPEEAKGLLPSWHFLFPQWFANDKAMFAGIIIGIILGKFKPKLSFRLAQRLDWLVDQLLFLIVCLIPLFVTGFAVKLAHDGILQLIIKDYAAILAVIACAQFAYISLAYFVLCRFNAKTVWGAMLNILPAVMTGFSTMSSAAAMPLTITGAEANAKHKDLAGATIPATVNIHLIGDCFAIPIFAYAVMKSFGVAEPSLAAYLLFLGYFVIAKFSVAAVPGGGILVMLPVLEKHLGFTSPMLSLMTALYVLFDPVITSANVFGNGAFALLIDRLVSFRYNVGLLRK